MSGASSYVQPMALVPYTDQGERLRLALDRAWILSDTHFLHTRLAEVYEAPARQALGVDHNDAMIDRWQATVDDNDLVVHLGDLALGRTGDFAAISEQLPGRKVLVKGNHDKRSRRWYADHGFEVIPPFWLDYSGWRVRFQHTPDYEREHVRYPRVLICHGHIHSKETGDPRQINLSVEAIDFTPQRLVDVLDERIGELSS